MSITVNTHMPLSRLCTSAGVGISYRSRLIATFSGFGSRQTLIRPSRFSVMTRLCTNSVRRSTLAITPRFSRSTSVCFNLSYRAYGTFRHHWSHVAVHLNVVFFLIFTKTSKHITVLSTHFSSVSTSFSATVSTDMRTRSNSMQALHPSMAISDDRVT